MYYSNEMEILHKEILVYFFKNPSVLNKRDHLLTKDVLNDLE